MKNYSVYILECSNGSLYTGYTTDLNKRYLEHLNGNGAKYTKAFKPKCIAVSFNFEDENNSNALKLEAKIKKKSRIEKIALVEQPNLIKIMYDEIVNNYESSYN